MLDLSFNINLQSLGGGFSCLIALTALNLSGLDSMWRQSPAPPPPAVDGDEGNNIGDNDNAADVEGADDDAVFPAADADLAALPHMQQLQLLPELRSFSSLINLSLASNRNMRMLPASLSALTRLQVLDARHCGINFLNDELWECLGLRELLLSDNVLSALPDDISRLQKLEVSEHLVVRNSSRSGDGNSMLLIWAVVDPAHLLLYQHCWHPGNQLTACLLPPACCRLPS